MQIAAGPGQPVISSCQREAESTRNLGGMREGREEGRGEGGGQHGGGEERRAEPALCPKQSQNHRT